MTLNVFWIDRCGRNAYVIVDSAGTHSKPPRFPRSLLGQDQWNQERQESVEEGYRKIIRINDQVAAILCGEEQHVHGIVDAVQKGLSGTASFDDTRRFFEKLTGGENFAVTLLSVGVEPAVVAIRSPEREFLILEPGHIHVEGSLEGDLGLSVEGFLRRGIEMVIDDASLPVEACLAMGLSCAVAAALEYDLTACSVGGAFFGGRVDRRGFHWQPDIVFNMFDQGATRDVPKVRVPRRDVPAQASPFVSVATRVRDDVCVAISSAELRGVAAGPNWPESRVTKWFKKWRSSLLGRLFSDARYYCFIPTAPGRIFVVREHRDFVRNLPGAVAFSNAIGDRVESSSNAEHKYELEYVRPSKHSRR